ncbi:U11/U12 small nuclear ribonucleoprotein 65 kDa protein isoform X2 [Cornus florida]|uniref:U11/U12 small nuclear ribonucleoprotein 65 kDa protein isoform X2 n=1 Tax=Cornus florida TaxID=4283 RepID=UPI00289B084C|nr:U11/U12 small nuclear ribonucleoprotein 65 kDa protein isoform X2 [Cornus florida]XP_059647289.1 U11/U12 small nuclear ribonucleoprotein 65 kDa protein isoform X2 [Cornus florida]
MGTNKKKKKVGQVSDDTICFDTPQGAVSAIASGDKGVNIAVFDAIMEGITPSQPFIKSEMTYNFEYQGVPEMASKLPEDASVTLLIRHLPEAIPYDTLSRLFSHYGASSLRPCASGRLRNCAFVDFKNEALASQAQRQLNGLRFLGKVLSVERASKPTESNERQQSEHQSGKHSTSLMKDSTMSKDLGVGTKLGSVTVSEPIAKRLGVDYPFPPHLEYAYPPPDGNILTNIVNALIAVPRFYTQVLHLMNKMNIPAPFRMALPTPPLPPSVLAPPPPPPPPPPSVATKPHLTDLSSDESEVESSDEEADDRAYSVGGPTVERPKRKRFKSESIVGPAVNKDVAHEAVGLKPASLVPKEIPVIKKKNAILQIKIVPKQIQSEQTETDIKKDLDEPENLDLDFKPYATPEELESGKLPPEEILSLPMFKNYTAGNPATVLYIKNLAKDVVADDFYFIFGSLFGSNDAAKSGLSVKLMQEGRMRGQAFVTFPSVELAHHALGCTRGTQACC